jgi:hypothetical protein
MPSSTKPRLPMRGRPKRPQFHVRVVDNGEALSPWMLAELDTTRSVRILSKHPLWFGAIVERRSVEELPQ